MLEYRKLKRILRESEMKVALIIKITGLLYNHGLRDLLIKYIDDPDNEWDEKLIAALDNFFGYEKIV